METTTITEEFISRMDDELRYNSSLYQKDGEPFGSQALSSMAGGSFPAVDLWHGLWYQGEMACLFGEPNVGKTILAMQIANELNKRGLKTLYFDFENAAHQFKSRYKTDKFNYSTGDGEFIVKPLNPNYSTAPLDSRSILDYIKKDFVTERAPVIIIDDITHLIGSGDQAALPCFHPCSGTFQATQTHFAHYHRLARWLLRVFLRLRFHLLAHTCQLLQRQAEQHYTLY